MIESQGLDKSKLAVKLGFSSRYIADIKAGKSNRPRYDFVLALINRLHFNPLWLETGEGEIILPPQSVQDITKTELRLRLPLLRQKVSCGPGINWQDDSNIVEYIEIFNLLPRLKAKRLFALCVEGSSMFGAGIRSGDYVLFDATEDRFLRDDIYVFALDGDVYCKRLEFDGISKKVKIYSVRVADLEKAELLTTIDMNDMAMAERITIFGRVLYWVHPNTGGN